MEIKIFCSVLDEAINQQQMDWSVEDLLLPHLNINHSVQEWLMKKTPFNKDHYVGIFAADPFTPWQKLIELLQENNIKNICNFPSVCFHDRAFRKLLEEGGVGETSEQNHLAFFKQHGFNIAWCAGENSVWQHEDWEPDVVLDTSGSFLLKDLSAPKIAFDKERVFGG